MKFLLLILFIIIIILFIINYNKQADIKTINTEIEEKNKKLKQEYNELINKRDCTKIELQQIIDNVAAMGVSAEQAEKNFQNTINQASEQYFKTLDNLYKEKEQEYEELIGLLEFNYIGKQDEMLYELEQTKHKLESLKVTRAAAIQANLREEEIKQKANFYSLSIDDIDRREIKILQSIESELRDPRPLKMIIWTSYYSKKANELAARILGPNEVCGIYKITNKNNNLCYIGQAKKIRERWREHMKCGLGIDTPANNKLYQAMLKDGLSNFTFELLEQCSSESLNEKEAYYIDLYDSYNYGYNSNKGITNK